MNSAFFGSALIALVGVGAGSAEPWQSHLPPEWLGIIVVSDLADFDRHTARLAEQFGIESPGLVRLRQSAGLTEVTDAGGSWLAGLARGPVGAEEAYPFAMIPVTDFAAFVKALDGDLRGTTAVVTLAQQDLLAGNCGSWALLMNPDQREILESVIARAPDATAILQEDPTATNGIASAHVSKLGLEWLAEYQSAGDQRSRQQMSARRKRGLAMLSLDGAKESLILDKPVWEWVAATFERAGITIVVDDTGKARVKIAAAKPQAASNAKLADESEDDGVIGNREWIFAGTVQFSPELGDLATGWQLAVLKSSPEEFGIKEFSPAEMTALEGSIKNAIGQVVNARFASLSSRDLPVHGNRVMVLDVQNVDDFLAACGELMQAWNAMIEASKAEVKLTFSAEPVEIAGHAGQRFFVDMVEAVDVPRSPEVAKVMADMFGPEGILSWYVLPMAEGQVAVANLPREEVETLIRDLKNGDAKPQATGGSARMKLDTSAYVDWGQRRDLTVTGDTVGGPRFVPLPKSDPLESNLTVRDGAVELELVLPPSLLKTLGKHAQETR
ncbi:MAG: hypothetical protein WD851_08400 [Pirellulales bacterium]